MRLFCFSPLLRVSAFFLLLIVSPAWAQSTSMPASAPAGRSDLLTLASGAVVLSRSSEYGGGQWSALALLDGTPTLGWCSAENAPFPHEVLVELARPTAIESLVLDAGQAQEANYPGISPKDVEVQASNVSPTEGFNPILKVQLPKGTRQEFRLNSPVTARWLKFIIRSNWGNANYTELMEVEAYGQPLSGTVVQAPLSGLFKTNYGLLQFDQAGNTVKGCYYEGAGVLNGNTDGRVVQFEWRQDHGQKVGTALMILSSKGDFINGFWYQNGSLMGSWFGERAKAGETTSCKIDSTGSAIQTGIMENGRSITYGIHFDYDSDKIKPDSEPTLNEVLTLLQKEPNLSLEIGGHTDTEGADAYNLDLSQRRAQSVVNWLLAKGIAPARLTAKGYGKTKPVSDNLTPEGRALNRRVELVKR
jgi:outer membrane protein OmpA-like peptidoglycan-associated protein